MNRRVIYTIVFLFFCLIQIAYGAFGLGRGRGGFDFAYIYVGGRCWIDCANPYIYSDFTSRGVLYYNLQSGFAYPPHVSLIAISLAGLSFSAARWLFVALSLAALIGLAYQTYLITSRARSQRLVRGAGRSDWIPISLVLLSPFAAAVLWSGQTSLVAGLALVAGWTFADRRHPVIAGFCFGLATIKPQLALLPYIWLCLHSRWKFVAASLSTGALLGSGTLLSSGPLETVTTWRGAIEWYRGAPPNQLGYQHTTSIQSMLAAADVPSPPDLTLVAVGLALVLWGFRHLFCATDQLPLLLLITFLFIPAHDYDYVALAPVAGAFWLHVAGSRRKSTVALGLVFLLYFPFHLPRATGIVLLMHWRTPVLFIVLVWLLGLSLRAAESCPFDGGEPLCRVTTPGANLRALHDRSTTE